MTYRHTQRGLVILASLLLPALLVGGIALASQNWFLLAVLLPLLLIAPMFSSLTVTVDDQAITVRFGVGVIQRRIVLTEIESVAPITTSWLAGWGIRMIPGGRLYNVSGREAVELRLADGQIVQIGTDDQPGLLGALHETIRTGLATADVAPSHDRTLAWIGGFIAGVGVLVAVMVILGMRPVAVTVTADAVDVSGAGYHAHVAASDISGIHLDEQLPSIRFRSNGFAASGRLRGHFTLSDGRSAQLFVTRDKPPFVRLETRGHQPVIFNLDDPQMTRALYAQLAR